MYPKIINHSTNKFNKLVTHRYLVPMMAAAVVAILAPNLAVAAQCPSINQVITYCASCNAPELNFVLPAGWKVAKSATLPADLTYAGGNISGYGLVSVELRGGDVADRVICSYNSIQQPQDVSHFAIMRAGVAVAADFGIWLNTTGSSFKLCASSAGSASKTSIQPDECTWTDI